MLLNHYNCEKQGKCDIIVKNIVQKLLPEPEDFNTFRLVGGWLVLVAGNHSYGDSKYWKYWCVMCEKCGKAEIRNKMKQTNNNFNFTKQAKPIHIKWFDF